jgi:hypothetical protein
MAAVPLLFLREIERTDPLARVERLLVEQFRRDEPDDLELETVRVPAVEALGRAVVRAADKRVGFGQPMRGGLELVERVDLPRQVVEADAGATGRRRGRARPHLEQPQVVVVGRAGRLEEGGPGEAVRRHRNRPEPEDVTVERDAAGKLADEQDGVVQTVNAHGPTVAEPY